MVSIAKDLISPEGLRTIANYLRSQHGVKVKSGIQHEKRVDYFKGLLTLFCFIYISITITQYGIGKRLVESLLNAKKWPKSLPLITEKEVALEVALLLLKNQFYHKSERIDGKKGYLKVRIKIWYHESFIILLLFYRQLLLESQYLKNQDTIHGSLQEIPLGQI